MSENKDNELKDRIRLYKEDEENYVYAIPVADVVDVILKIWGDVVDEMIDHDAPWSWTEEEAINKVFRKNLGNLDLTLGNRIKSKEAEE